MSRDTAGNPLYDRLSLVLTLSVAIYMKGDCEIVIHISWYENEDSWRIIILNCKPLIPAVIFGNRFIDAYSQNQRFLSKTEIVRYFSQ